MKTPRPLLHHIAATVFTVAVILAALYGPAD